MIRKNHSHGPLYREMIRDALLTAWQEKRLWPLALLAAVLQTGGIYDVVLFSVRGMTSQGLALSLALPWRGWLTGGWSLSFATSAQAWASWSWIINVVFGMLFVVALLCASIIAQGALVAGLGGKIRGRSLSLQTCCRIGSNAFWPVVGLNIFSLGLLWCLRFPALILLSQFFRHGWVPVAFGWLLMIFVFLVGVVILTSIHLFALNAIVLQDATLWQAIERGWHVLRQVWFTILETALILFVVGALCFCASVLLFLVMGLPLFLFMLASLALQSLFLLGLGLLLAWLLLMVIMVVGGMFALTFQYAVWVRLYRRAGEGGAAAKVHRLVHWLTGDYHSRGV